MKTSDPTSSPPTVRLSVDEMRSELGSVVHEHLSKLGLPTDFAQRRVTVCALLRMAAADVVRSGVSPQVFAALAQEAYQHEVLRQRERSMSGCRPVPTVEDLVAKR